jgi:hypothetical protein
MMQRKASTSNSAALLGELVDPVAELPLSAV